MHDPGGANFLRILDQIRHADEERRRAEAQLIGHRGLQNPLSETLNRMRQLDAVRRSLLPDLGMREVIEERRRIAAFARPWRLFDELGLGQHQAELGAFMSVRRGLEELESRIRQESVAEDVLRRVTESRRLLLSAARSFPGGPSDVPATLGRELSELIGRLDLSEAALLTEVAWDGENDLTGAELEEQLIEAVPAQALAALQRIEFVPFSLLAAAVSDPRILFEITPRTFEQFIAELMARLGVEDVVLTPERKDGGRDVLGTARIADIPLLLAFECKRYSPGNPVAVETARALLGTISHGEYRADKGILVTTSHFSDAARRFIVTAPQLDGRDFAGIVKWLEEYARRQGATVLRAT